MPERKFPLPKGVVDDGHFNHAPSPIRQATESEFWGAAPFTTPAEYRQITKPSCFPGYPHKYYASCYIWWLDCGAWLVIPPTKWGLDEHQQVKYEEPALYYWVGCDHENTTCRNLGRCYNEYTCKDCGYVWRIDSSD